MISCVYGCVPNPSITAPPSAMSGQIPISKIAKGITLEQPPADFESWSKNLYGKAFHRDKHILDQAQEMSKLPLHCDRWFSIMCILLWSRLSSCRSMVCYLHAMWRAMYSAIVDRNKAALKTRARRKVKKKNKIRPSLHKEKMEHIRQQKLAVITKVHACCCWCNSSIFSKWQNDVQIVRVAESTEQRRLKRLGVWKKYINRMHIYIYIYIYIIYKYIYMKLILP